MPLFSKRPSGYKGPLDYISAGARSSCAVFCSTRRGSNQWTGPLLNCRRSSDNVARDLFWLSNGALNWNDANSFLSGTTGFVPVFYDQSGAARNLTQGTAANQPGLTSGPISLVKQNAAVTAGMQTANYANFINTNPNSVICGMPLLGNGGSNIGTFYSIGSASNGKIKIGNSAGGHNVVSRPVTTNVNFANILTTSSTLGNVISHTFNAGTTDAGLTAWVGGASAGAPATSDSITALSNVPLIIFDSGLGSTANNATGALYEIMAFTSALSNQDRQILEKSMGEFFNIPFVQ